MGRRAESIVNVFCFEVVERGMRKRDGEMDVGKGRVIGKRTLNFQQRRSLSVEAGFGSLSLHSFARIGCPWLSYVYACVVENDWAQFHKCVMHDNIHM